MAQLIAAIIATVFTVAFAMSNMHHVQLSCIIGAPVEIRLIFLMMATFAAGALTASFYGMVRRVIRRNEARRLQLAARKAVVRTEAA
jgi:uncharacterized integral membrane protein